MNKLQTARRRLLLLEARETSELMQRMIANGKMHPSAHSMMADTVQRKLDEAESIRTGKPVATTPRQIIRAGGKPALEYSR